MLASISSTALIATYVQEFCRMSLCLECIFVGSYSARSDGTLIIGCGISISNTDVKLFNSEVMCLLKLLECERNKIVIIFGDFNLDLLKHSNHMPTSDFLNMMLSNSLFPVICKPTILIYNSVTLIDNIFINCIHDNFDSAIIYNDISDHFPIALYITNNSDKKKPEASCIRVYDAKSMQNFKANLAVKCWDNVYNSIENFSGDPSKAYDCILHEFKATFDKSFPEKLYKCSKKMTPRNDWMNNGLIKSYIKNSTLFKRYKQNSTDQNKRKQYYVAYRNKLKAIVVKAE